MARDEGPVQIRLRLNLDGMVENVWSPRRGDVLTVPLAAARRYVANGYAQTALTGPLGNAYDKAG